MTGVLPPRWISTIAACLVSLLGLSSPAHAQSASFEVASIKPSNPNPTGPIGLVVPALGRLTATNATLRRLVYAAYQLPPFQVLGGPSWQNTNRFDINAKANDASVNSPQILELLRTLLAERFKLKVHRETRDMPIYTLTVARKDGRLGSMLKPAVVACRDVEAQEKERAEVVAKGGLSALQPRVGETGPCAIALLPSTSVPGSIEIHATGQTMRSLALSLTTLMDHLVVDKTNLPGLYDFNLTVDLQTLTRLAVDLGDDARPQPAASQQAPALRTQLQEDLGLKLDAQRGPGEVLVIDSAELPTPD